MTKKLEEVFNLPPIDDMLEDETEAPKEEKITDIVELQDALSQADKIDRALAPVKGLEQLDSDMDDYAQQAISAFQDLMDLGNNVEDRHAAPVFDSAAKMMQNALAAKQAKMDKKLKVIQMQMQKEKLELEKRKLEFQIQKSEQKEDDTPIEGNGEVLMDRNELINSIMQQMKKD